jgi:transcriptional regulator with XRE-family HTH domain
LGRVVKLSDTALWGVLKNQQIEEEVRKFGANIRRERTGQGITQQRLAELADLNVRTVQKIEAGQITVLITTAMRLQKALGCAWGRLF